MTIVPHGEDGQPLTPIAPLRPMLFTGTALWVFDDSEEYDQWLKDNQPIPQTEQPTDNEYTTDQDQL
jgi:hypothetical protein